MFQLFNFRIQRILLMDYIFKSELLSLDQHKHLDYQYYQWYEKNKREKQNNEYERLRKTWFQIEEDQKKQNLKQKKEHKTSYMQKQKVASSKPEQTYIKNMIWKQNVQLKIQQIRLQRTIQTEQKEIQSMEKENQSQTQHYQNRHHEGPIKAWKQRFDNYLKAKSGEDVQESSDCYFHPTIDRNSRRITNKMVGKVQDRLLNYGQKLKQKKLDMELSYEVENYYKRNHAPQNDSIKSELSDVFWRLYKDGEKMNKKRNMQTSSFSFTPEINQYSIQMVSRMNEKRMPLYPIKNDKQQRQAEHDIKKKQNVKSKYKGFTDFIKRNQVLLAKIEANKIKKMEMIKQKEQREDNQCTFVPNLNPKSLKIFSNRQAAYVQNQPKNKQQQLESHQKSQIISLPLKDKKMSSIPSANQNLQSTDKLSSRTEAIQRLSPLGNMKQESKYIQVNEIDSISNDFRPDQFKPMQPESFDYKKSMSKSKELQFDFLATDRLPQNGQIYNIHEQIQEDSIQNEKETQWQRELFNVQRRIEEMMSRSSN